MKVIKKDAQNDFMKDMITNFLSWQKHKDKNVTIDDILKNLNDRIIEWREIL